MSVLLEVWMTEHKMIASVALIVVMLFLRWAFVRHLSNKSGGDVDRRRHWINTIRNTTILMIAVGLVFIWISELRFLALSVAAFIVALVIATREFIQCLMGSIYLASTRTFVVGDWIQVGHNYGEVVSCDWLSTTLLEIDIESASYEYTGKTLVIPNNQFVATTIKNMNFMRRFIAHSFAIVREHEHVNVFDAKQMILEKAAEYCSPFIDVAQRYSGLIEKRLGGEIIGPNPSVRITTTNLGKNQFTVTVFCPPDEAVAIEQRLIEDFMAFWYSAYREAENHVESTSGASSLQHRHGDEE